MPLKTYPVLSPILADRRYEEGEIIKLEDDQAAELTRYGAIGETIGDATDSAPPKLRADEAIAKIKVAATLEEVDAIIGDDQRVTVVAAATARRAELTEGT